MRLTRRTLIGGLAASVAAPVLANAPATSIRPAPRGPGHYKLAVRSAQELIQAAGLGGKVSFAVADARTGALLETRAPLLPQPPASTAKALTSLYGLASLGADHRFDTRLVATGPITGGRLEGDLVLVGGGDPTLDTDALADLAARLKDTGLREITGSFMVWDGALPRLHDIDIEQPDHVGYNPALGGLNLNYNRVHFEWRRQGSDYQVSMDARSARYRPDVTVSRMQVMDRRAPVYTYAKGAGRDEWTVARGALGKEGARWLPVRRPALYAGEVFQTFARSHGIDLGRSVGRAEGPGGTELVRHQSAPLAAILQDMLKYSTNLTAEVVGLSSSQARGPAVQGLTQSAARMNGWLAEDGGGGRAALVDHSGLGGASRISARDMVRAMVASGPNGDLRRMMKTYRIADRSDVAVQAKTGTLNFVSALTGYVKAPGDVELAFAIFCADAPRRAALTVDQRDRPAGGLAWSRRARALHWNLLDRWSTVHGA